MKPLLFSLALLFTICLFSNSQAQTTIANGNWSNPLTWGGTPPLGTGTVVINHTVTLDIDYSHSSGSITINNSGALNGNSPMRGFAINYPAGSATLTNVGSLNIARVSLFPGSVANFGSFQADSLLNLATLTNNTGGTINADQFLNDTLGILTNDGDIISLNFLNLETATNDGSISTNDFSNSKSFINSATGTINTSNDFSNINSLTGPAILTNDGLVSVVNNWHNDNQVNGTGRFCIGNNTWNSGSMTGTFDFCDQTGGGIDLNTGTVAGTITYCAIPCNVGREEGVETGFIRAYPNPFSTEVTFQADKEFRDATLMVFNMQGQVVRQINNVFGQTIRMNRDQLPAGLYFFSIMNQGKAVKGKIVID